MSFEVAMKALLHDADAWHHMHQDLDTMSSDTASLQLDASAFSFAGGDVHASYEAVRSFVAQFLGQGATQVNGAGDALVHVHAIYAGTDEAAKADLDSQWKWS